MATQPIHLDYQQIITDDREPLIEDSFRLWGSELILFFCRVQPTHTSVLCVGFFCNLFSVIFCLESLTYSLGLQIWACYNKIHSSYPMIAIRWSLFRRKDIKKTKWLLWVRLAIRWPHFTWATFIRMSLKLCFMRNSHKVRTEMTCLWFYLTSFSWPSIINPSLSWHDHKKIAWICLCQFPTASWCRTGLGYNEFWCYQNQWPAIGELMTHTLWLIYESYSIDY